MATYTTISRHANPFANVAPTVIVHPVTGEKLTGHAYRQYVLASARLASCPDARAIARLSEGRRTAVINKMAEARRTLGLSPSAELAEAVNRELSVLRG